MTKENKKNKIMEEYEALSIDEAKIDERRSDLEAKRARINIKRGVLRVNLIQLDCAK